MSTEQNKNIVRRFWKAYEANDEDALNRILSPALVAMIPNTPVQQNREMHMQGIRNFTAAFSDRHFTIEEMIAEGDLVATRATLRGIHTGAFQSIPPTGKHLTATGLTLERVQDGQIVERWFSFETERVLQELTAVAPPAA